MGAEPSPTKKMQIMTEMVAHYWAKAAALEARVHELEALLSQQR